MRFTTLALCAAAAFSAVSPAYAEDERPTLTTEELQEDANMVSALMLLSTRASVAVASNCPFDNETLCKGHRGTVQSIVRNAFTVITQLTEGTKDFNLGDDGDAGHFVRQRARMHAEGEAALDALEAVIDASTSD